LINERKEVIGLIIHRLTEIVKIGLADYNPFTSGEDPYHLLEASINEFENWI
jgi:hypothetical protein